MAKCYLMLEDGPGGLQFAGNFGRPMEELPKDHNDLTESEYTLHRFLAVLRQMEEPDVKAAQKSEVASAIVVPEHLSKNG